MVAVYAPYLLVEFGGAFFGATVAGTTTLSLSGAVTVGAISGFAGTGTLKGALTGALTAGLMYGVGDIAKNLALADGGVGKIALHAGAGCVSSMVGGGSCKSGAAAGALGELGANRHTDNMAMGNAKGAMLNGLGSKVSGGKFADGAIRARQRLTRDNPN